MRSMLIYLLLALVLQNSFAWTDINNGGSPSISSYSSSILKTVAKQVSAAFTFYGPSSGYLWGSDSTNDYIFNSAIGRTGFPVFSQSGSPDVIDPYQQLDIKYLATLSSGMVAMTQPDLDSRNLLIFDASQQSRNPYFAVLFVTDEEPRQPIFIEATNYVVCGAGIPYTSAGVTYFKRFDSAGNSVTASKFGAGHVVRTDYTSNIVDNGIMLDADAKKYSSFSWQAGAYDYISGNIYYGGRDVGKLDIVILSTMAQLITINLGTVQVGYKVNGVEVTDDSKYIAVGVNKSPENTLRVLSCPTGQQLSYHTISNSATTLTIKAMRYSYLIIGRLDMYSSLYIWNIESQDFALISSTDPTLLTTFAVDNYQRFIIPLDKIYILSVCSPITTENIPGLAGCGKCPAGKYYESSTKICEQCESSCKTCTGPTGADCSSCNPPNDLIDGYCQVQIPICGSGQYINGPGCGNCDLSCAECTGGSSNQCSACSTLKFLYQNICYTTCPSKMYGGSGTCLPCDNTCKECQGGDLNSCKSCDTPNFLLIQNPVASLGSCVSSCPLGKFGDIITKTCISCDTSCKECIGGSNSDCISCSTPNLFSFGECLMNCRSGTYSTGSSCLNCDPSCLDCFGGNPEDCSSCSPPSFFFNSKCLPSCPSKTYKIGNSCNPCDTSCDECSGRGSSSCISCPFPNVLYQQTCIGTCPLTTYLDSRVCKDCDPNCQSCRGPGIGDCLSCPFNKLLENGTCADVCSSGMYRSGTECLKCDESCEQCSSGLATGCLSCTSLRYLWNQECLTKCPEGSFEDIASRVCSECHISCQTCTGPSETDCNSCSSPLILEVSTCLAKCSPGFSETNVGCQPCLNNCLSCDPLSLGSCLSCPPNLKLSKTECVLECPKSTFFEELTKTCKDCPKYCETCISRLGCETCDINSPNKYLFNSECLESCPSSTYISGNTCSVCAAGCKECENSDTCTSCSQDSSLPFLFKQKCFGSLPERTYFDEDKNEYFECDGAQEFTNIPEECKPGCPTNQVLYLGKCIDTCPKGLLKENGQCVKIEEYRFARVAFFEDKSIMLKDGFDIAFDLVLIDESTNSTLNESISKNIFLDPNNFKFETEDKILKNNFSRVGNTWIVWVSFANLTQNDRSIDVELMKDQPFPDEKLIVLRGKQSLKIEVSILSSDQINTIVSSSQIGLDSSNHVATGIEIASVASTVSSMDPSGSLMKLSLNCKLISRLSFIDVYYGSLLDPILLQAGASFAKSSKKDRNFVEKMETGSKGRLSKANISLQIGDKLDFKIVLYLCSWFLRLALMRFHSKLVNKKNSSLSFVKVLYYHKKIHFAVLNLIMSDGVFLCSRSLIHGSPFSSEAIMSAMILTLVIIDLCLLFNKLNIIDDRNEFNNKKKEEFIKALEKIQNERNIDKNASSQKLISRNLSDIPKKIPVSWIPEKIALELGYKRIIDNKYLSKLSDYDESVVKFRTTSYSATNPKIIAGINTDLLECISLTRIGIYQMIIIGVSKQAIPALIILLLLEGFFMSMIIISGFKGAYISKVHFLKCFTGSLSILFFFFFTSAICYLNNTSDVKEIPLSLQIGGLVLVTISMISELGFSILIAVWSYYLNKQKTKLLPRTECIFFIHENKDTMRRRRRRRRTSQKDKVERESEKESENELKKDPTPTQDSINVAQFPLSLPASRSPDTEYRSDRIQRYGRFNGFREKHTRRSKKPKLNVQQKKMNANN